MSQWIRQLKPSIKISEKLNETFIISPAINNARRKKVATFSPTVSSTLSPNPRAFTSNFEGIPPYLPIYIDYGTAGLDCRCFKYFFFVCAGDRNLSRDKSQTEKLVCYSARAGTWLGPICSKVGKKFENKRIYLMAEGANRRRLVQFIRMLVDWLLMNLWCPKSPRAGE